MELKRYQKKTLNDIDTFIECLKESGSLDDSWAEYWALKDHQISTKDIPAYNDITKGVPQVCVKIPTGGGKTLIGAASLKHIFDARPNASEKVAVWLVPSDSIREQTIANFINPDHPYHQQLEKDFQGRVNVFTSDMLLSGQGFSPESIANSLSVCIMSYATIRISGNKKDSRRMYYDNGNLVRFADFLQNRGSLREDIPETALIQVLRSLNPVVIVDESHNTCSKLSREMLEILNPCFILDMTATPIKGSNIIAYVDAVTLKKENMVKLPVIVYNRKNSDSVLSDSIQLRGYLENEAIKAYESGQAGYIRPIVLVQAESDTKENSETFTKIKEKLVSYGVPKSQIAIKTADVNELKGVDLLSPSCEIRYIITVNALKEGWDCPFAYILASIANKKSKIDVEQILGRILRQPYAKQVPFRLLNNAFVFASSSDTIATLDEIVKGLLNAGFTERDYRVATEDDAKTITRPVPAMQKPIDMTSEINWGESSYVASTETQPLPSAQAESQPPYTSSSDAGEFGSILGYAFEADNDFSDNSNSGQYDNPDERHFKAKFAEEMKTFAIPQFRIKESGNSALFDLEDPLLTPEFLSKTFDPSKQNADVDLSISEEDVYAIDVSNEEGRNNPWYRKLDTRDQQDYRKFLDSLPPEARRFEVMSRIVGIINKHNSYDNAQIRSYVQRVLANVSPAVFSSIEGNEPIYAKKILDTLLSFEQIHREKEMQKLADTNRIYADASYVFPEAIELRHVLKSIPKGLYEGESDSINAYERDVISTIASMDNVRWWHRNTDRVGFCLNGFINHYPDFIVKMESGITVLVETKGNHLANEDSRRKSELGKLWQSLAGKMFKYFMVFETIKAPLPNAYTKDEFYALMREL